MKKRLFVAALAVFALFMMGCTKEIANEDNKNVSDNNDNLIECDNCNNGCNDGDACDCYNGCNCNDDCDDDCNDDCNDDCSDDNGCNDGGHHGGGHHGH